MNREIIVNKLFSNQLKNVDNKYRLNPKDIIRLSSYLNTDPFSENECCKWKGAISKSSHDSKYINFWFNKKKQALHRILYLNYKGELPKNKYLKFTCPNSNMHGMCCNVNHIELINENTDNKNNDEYNQSDQPNHTIKQTNICKIKKTKNNNVVNDDQKIELTQNQINQLKLSEEQLNQLKLLEQLNLITKTSKPKKTKKQSGQYNQSGQSNQSIQSNQSNQYNESIQSNQSNQSNQSIQSNQSKQFIQNTINEMANNNKSKQTEENKIIITTKKNYHDGNRFIIIFDD
jgi:hypothetical protein